MVFFKALGASGWGRFALGQMSSSRRQSGILQLGSGVLAAAFVVRFLLSFVPKAT